MLDMLMAVVTYVVPFVLILSVIVFVHEFGHFIVGRWCGVRVDAFSIGFGPELWSRFDRHGTRWRIAAIPMGGYVKFHGDANAASAQDADALVAMPAAERAVTFAAQPIWKRAAIVVAGPLANFLLAIALFAAIFSLYGRTVLTPRVGEVVAGGAGERAGFQRGDLVLTIDGEPIDAFSQMQEIVSVSADRTLVFVVRRGDSDLRLEATPAWREVNGPMGKQRIGMLGLKASTDAADAREEYYGPVRALGLAAGETWQVTHQTGAYLAGLITGRETTEQLSGPIGIARISGEVAQAATKVGMRPVLHLIALLSVSVGLLNLLPVPLLDGGHLLFFAIEAARGGRALNERAQEFAFRVGLAMVGVLMIFSTYNDISRLIQRITGGAS